MLNRPTQQRDIQRFVSHFAAVAYQNGGSTELLAIVRRVFPELIWKIQRNVTWQDRQPDSDLMFPLADNDERISSGQAYLLGDWKTGSFPGPSDAGWED